MPVICKSVLRATPRSSGLRSTCQSIKAPGPAGCRARSLIQVSVHPLALDTRLGVSDASSAGGQA
jgi:hypothetical protein